MRRHYPFEALRGVRRDAVDQRAAALGERTRATELAAAARRGAEAAREAEQRRTDHVAGAERDRLEQGLATAGDLSRQADFARGAAQRIAARAAAECGARHREIDERAAEQRARASLARADADHRALEKHRDGWDQKAQLAAERGAEDDALDHFNARRPR